MEELVVDLLFVGATDAKRNRARYVLDDCPNAVLNRVKRRIEIKLPATSGPRWVTPLFPETWIGLLRTNAPSVDEHERPCATPRDYPVARPPPPRTAR